MRKVHTVHTEIPLSEAAQVLRRGLFATRSMILRGELTGRLDAVTRRWLVTRESVERVQRLLREQERDAAAV